MTTMINAEDSFIDDAMRRVAWEIAYHELQLPRAIKAADGLKVIIKKISPGIDIANITYDDYEEDENGDIVANNPMDYLKSLIAEKLGSVSYHEQALVRAYKSVGYIKALLARGLFPEINWGKICAEERQKAAAR